MYTPWPRDRSTRSITFYQVRFGPHGGDFAVLFADGHAAADMFNNEEEAVLWTGPRWWITRYRQQPENQHE
jgi:prepilin-type processing-associated H-X9-DG protein